jgi:MFS family permease
VREERWVGPDDTGEPLTCALRPLPEALVFAAYPFPQVEIDPAHGLFLANVAVLVFSAVSGDQFLTWGWRIPFALSIIMIGIGLYIRLGIFETPVFSRILAAEQVARAPSFEVIRRQPKEVILTALARMGEQAPGFVYTAYIFTFGTVVLGASRDFLLTALIVCTALGFLWVPIAGHLSDRLGRRRMYMF